MKIGVAMSGGIDSSAAALMLKEAGHKIHGFTMLLFDEGYNAASKLTNSAVMKAEKICEYLNIEHTVVDLRKEFENSVIKYFTGSYISGLTPNPCVFCNPFIKFGLLLDKVLEMGYDKLATGHYIDIEEKNGQYYLKKGIDNVKDQSYFVSRVKREVLKYLLFPLGNKTKDETINFVKQEGIKIEGGESQEICFIPDNDYENFIRSYISDIPEGDFIDENGKVVGRHKGIPFYTIGQRRGLGVALGKPGYVRNINPENNVIEIGDMLLTDEFNIDNVNILAPEYINEELTVKVRYRHKGEKAFLVKHDNNGLYKVKLKNKVQSIAPGQSAVFYHGDYVVCSGIILKN